MSQSDLEHAFLFELRRNNLRGFVCEYPFKGFNGQRRWRFDVAYEEEKVACEVMGGLFSNGKHSREAGFANDSRKSAEAQLMGWKVINVTPSMIKDGSAVALVKEALGRSDR